MCLGDAERGACGGVNPALEADQSVPQTHIETRNICIRTQPLLYFTGLN